MPFEKSKTPKQRVHADEPKNQRLEADGAASMMPPAFQLTADPAKSPAQYSAPIQMQQEEEKDDGWGVMDWVHTGLDIAGLVPVLGEAFDLINAGIYAAEGDYLNAGLSAASAVPLAGYAATATKLGIKGADAAKTALKGAKNIEKGKDVAKAGENVMEEASGGAYRLLDEEGVVRRTGRTKDHAVRKQQHANQKETKDLSYDATYRTDDLEQQRGLEHLLFEAHESTANKANGGLNKIKAISDKNKKKPLYLQKAMEFLNLD